MEIEGVFLSVEMELNFLAWHRSNHEGKKVVE